MSSTKRLWVGSVLLFVAGIGGLLLAIQRPGDASGPSDAAGVAQTTAPQPTPPPARPLRVETVSDATGVVRRADRTPVPGARVQVFGASPKLRERCTEQLREGCPCEELDDVVAALDGALDPLAETTTNASGEFRFSAVKGVRPLRFLAVAPDGALGDQEGREQRPSRPVPIVAERAAQSVRAVTASGAPVEGATVVALNGNAITEITQTDGAGRAALQFRFSTAAVALADGFLPSALTWLDGDGPAVSELRLEPGHFVTGAVRDSSGPRAGLTVEARRGYDSSCGKAVTDAQGRYRLGPLLPGPVRLSPAGLSKDVTVGVDVGAGDNVADFALAGTATVRVHVRSTDGRPIAGAEVWITSFVDGRSGTGEQHVANATGDVTAAVFAGKVWAKAKAPGFLTPGLGTDRERWEVEEGGVVQVDLVLVPAVTLTGRVLDDHGLPKRNLSFWAHDAADSDLGFPRADGTGSFRLDVAPGEVTLSFHEDGLVPREVKATAPGHVEIVLRPDSPGQGVSGRVVDEQRRPVQGVGVHFSHTGSRESAHAASQEDGTFVTKGRLSDGVWLVEGRHRVIDGSSVYTDLSGEATVEVTAGTAPFLELVVRASRELSGIVVDAAGQPVGGALIRVSHGVEAQPEPPETRATPPPAMSWMPAMNAAGLATARQNPDATSAADGRFTVKGLHQVATVHVVNEEWVVDPARPAVVRPTDAQVVVHVVGTPTVTGRVVDARGRPVPTFSVARIPQSSRVDGSFRARLRRFGEIEASVWAEGFEKWSRWVTLAPGKSVNLGEVRLTRARKLEVRAVDAATGAEVQDVWWSNADGGKLGSPERVNGRTVLSSVPGEAFVLRARTDVYLPATTLVRAQQQRAEVTLVAGSTLKGQVVGLPAAARLYARIDGCPGASSVAVEADGRFTIGGRTAGQCTVVVKNEGGVALATGSVQLPATGTVEVVLTAGAP